MSILEKKEFTMKHIFEEVDKMEEGDTIEGPIEYHYGIPWRIRIDKTSTYGSIYTNEYLDCPMSSDFTGWSIKAHIDTRFEKKADGPNFGSYEKHFCREKTFIQVGWIGYYNHYRYCVDGKLAVDLSVRIDKMSGNFEKVQNFNSDKNSDVVFIVGDQRFHVNKVYLATHCTYFDTLFFGNSTDSGKAEFELKDIKPEDFQQFLEFLYLRSSIEAHSVLGILHLAVFFDAKTAIKRCEDFMIHKLGLPLEQKLETAIKYNLEELKIKCILELPLKERFLAAFEYNLDELKTRCILEVKNVADFEAIVPKEGAQFENAIWNELFQKALAMLRK